MKSKLDKGKFNLADRQSLSLSHANTHTTPMGIWDFVVGSTAEVVNRNIQKATPLKEAFINSGSYGTAAFTKIAEPVKSACKNSYSCGSTAVAKIDHTVRTICLRRDVTSGACENISAEERGGGDATPGETNSCSYGGGAFAKIEEAVTTPVKSMSYKYGFLTFAKIGYTVRVKVVCRIVQRISADGTKSTVTIFTHESEGGNEFITGQVVGMPVKNECNRSFYMIDFITFARIGYVFRVNILGSIEQSLADPNIRSRIIKYITILGRNARKHAMQPGIKFTPGSAAIFIILCKTLIDILIEELSKEKAGSPKQHYSDGQESIPGIEIGDKWYSAAYEFLKDKIGVFALDEMLVFVVKEIKAFLNGEPFRTQFFSRNVLTMESLVFMMREFFVFMMKQLFGDKFLSGIDEIVVAVLREIFGIEIFNGQGFH